ncbi:MAG TPA: nuclear transport factor 2 family protein [Methylomirabilota bacterium]|nr:nuclear transport factor 2 family protein [Methylomirabilota bacterium]
MTSRSDGTSNEAEIRQLMDDWVRAVRAKDVGAAVAGYAPEVISFDLAPPLEYRGVTAIRKSLEEWFPTFRGPVGYELRDLAITAGDEVGFAHSLNRISGTRTDGTETDVWVRATVCFRKLGGGWRMTHDHVSAPFEMTPPFKASLGLKP